MTPTRPGLTVADAAYTYAAGRHVCPAMRSALTAMLKERWEASLRERAQLSPRSIVPVLNALLAAQREQPTKIGSHLAPKIGHRERRTIVNGQRDAL